MQSHITDFDDPRLDPYRNLRDKQIAPGGRFLVEGIRNTLRLLESGLRVESVLVAENRLAELAQPARCAELYVVSRELMMRIVGHEIHTGVLSVGFRPPPLSIDEMMARAAKPYTLFAAPILQDQENLGALIRTAAAFGATGLLLGERSCDPFFRRVIRVSMGTVFRFPIVWSDRLERDLLALRERWNVELVATVLDESAEPLPGAKRNPARDGIAVLMGHESDGLDARTAALCDRKITIPMHLGTDSLNIAVSAAVFSYHFLPPRKPIRLLEGGWG